MDVDPRGREICTMCGKDTDEGRWFCHFYSEQGRDTFCSPACADAFLHRPLDAATGEHAWRPAAPRGATYLVLD